MAEGRDLAGFSDSAAARPTSSVPEKEKAAVTKTPQKPTKSVNAPGSCHLLPPWYSENLYWLALCLMLWKVDSAYSPLDGPPPQTKITPMNRKTMIVVSFRIETQNSSSAYPRTPNKLMMQTARKNTTIQTATCTSLAPSHHWTVRPATTSSSGRTIA